MNHGALGRLRILARHSYSNEQRHINTKVFWPTFMRKGRWCKLRTITHDWKVKVLISTESNIPVRDRDDKDQATAALQDHEFCQILEDTRCQRKARLAANLPLQKFREKVNIHTLIPTIPKIQVSILKTVWEIHEQKAKILEEWLINLERWQLQLSIANLAIQDQSKLITKWIIKWMEITT